MGVSDIGDVFLFVWLMLMLSQVSGANAGPCSANSGTLMYAEIMSIIADNDIQPALDPVAAVESIVWGTCVLPICGLPALVSI